MSDPLLRLDSLKVQLPDRGRYLRVLEDVSFEIEPGQIVGLVGESGSGKSMTARAILRLLPHGARLSGQISLRGVEIPAGGKALRRIRAHTVAMIFQDPRAHIDPLYRNGDHLIEGLRLARGITKEAARLEALRLLDSVGIDDPERVFRAYPSEVSGGMLQRVLIAGALAGDPDLIIADEPTTALDVTTQAEIVALLGRLCRDQGRGILFITHDLDLASAISHRIVVMYAGRVVEENLTSRFFSAPMHPYSARLLRARPTLERRTGALAVIPGRPISAFEAPPGCPFNPRCSYTTPDCMTDPPPLVDVDGGSSACRRVLEIRNLLTAEINGA